MTQPHVMTSNKIENPPWIGEEILGVDLEDLRSLKPQIEMLIVAKRNGIPARVVVDPVEVF